MLRLSNTADLLNKKREPTEEPDVKPIELDFEKIKQESSKAGGVYIPPHKMAAYYKTIQEKADKSSEEYQRMTWEMLKKSINGVINKVNKTNIHNVLFELFNENLIRGEGLLARAIIKNQMASPNFTHVYAALLAVINTKFPYIVRLVIDRYLIQFNRSFKRNNKIICKGSAKMLAHCINQLIVHHVLALELLTVLLEEPTEDSVEMASEFIIECGKTLNDLIPQGLAMVFDRFRAILQEGSVDKRVQFTIQSLFAVRKTGFKDYPGVLPELDLVEEDERITHEITLDDEEEKPDPKMHLDVFKFDNDFEQHEREWEEMRNEIIGDEQAPAEAEAEEKPEVVEEDLEEDDAHKIIDFTETDLINLRKTIYLTVSSSVDVEECVHKLLKIKILPQMEPELTSMIAECCMQEKTYLRFFGLVAQRLCEISEMNKLNFENQFEVHYTKIHRLDTNKLRNLSKMYAHLLFTDAIEWTVLRCIRLTEEDTTSLGRIFVKNIFLDLCENYGMRELVEKLEDSLVQESTRGIFIMDNPTHTRFAINFFTSIGLGVLTENMREFLERAQKYIEEQLKLEEGSDYTD